MPQRRVPHHHANHQGTGRDWFPQSLCPIDAYTATRDVEL